jgi:hypothetical protein
VYIDTTNYPKTLASASMEVSVAQPQIGSPAPDFSVPSTAPSGTTSLAELRGKKVVLAFYIYDFTGG